MTYAALHTNRPELVLRRRKLRRAQTMAEKVMWYELRDRRKGYKWRRQCSIKSFIADFCCFELRLVIELDGPVHEEQKGYDRWRDKKLREQGFKVIRYINDDVLFNRDQVLADIVEQCEKRKQEIKCGGGV